MPCRRAPSRFARQSRFWAQVQRLRRHSTIMVHRRYANIGSVIPLRFSLLACIPSTPSSEGPDPTHPKCWAFFAWAIVMSSAAVAHRRPQSRRWFNACCSCGYIGRRQPFKLGIGQFPWHRGVHWPSEASLSARWPLILACRCAETRYELPRSCRAIEKVDEIKIDNAGRGPVRSPSVSVFARRVHHRTERCLVPAGSRADRRRPSSRQDGRRRCAR